MRATRGRARARWMVAVAAALTVSALGAGAVVTTGAQAAEVAATRFPGDPGSGKLYLGAADSRGVGDGGQDGVNNDIATLTTYPSARVSMFRSYFNPGADDNWATALSSQLAADKAAHRLSWVSVKTPKAGASGNVSWAATTNAWINQVLDRMDAQGQPAFLSIWHEPEDQAANPPSGSGWTPADWRGLQSRAINQVLARPSSKVTIVPTVMGYTFSKQGQLAGRNPSDWIVSSAKVYGIDAYNKWRPGDADDAWREVQQIMEPSTWVDHGVTRQAGVRSFVAASVPIGLGEVGTKQDPSSVTPTYPDRTAANWLSNAFNYSRNNNIVALSYYNNLDKNDPAYPYRMSGDLLQRFAFILATRPTVARLP